MATLNQLAPGRVHLGIGTGNTAMRTMGQRPMRIADYDEYLGVLAGSCAARSSTTRYRDRERPIRMLTDNKEYIGLEPKIPLYVSGFGPRAMELAGQARRRAGLRHPAARRGRGRGARPRASPAPPARGADSTAFETAR